MKAYRVYLLIMTFAWTILAGAAYAYGHWFQGLLETLLALLFAQLYGERRWP